MRKLCYHPDFEQTEFFSRQIDKGFEVQNEVHIFLIVLCLILMDLLCVRLVSTHRSQYADQKMFYREIKLVFISSL